MFASRMRHGAQGLDTWLCSLLLISSDCFWRWFGLVDGTVMHQVDFQKKDFHRSSYREGTGQTSKMSRNASNVWALCPTLERKTVPVLSQCTTEHSAPEAAHSTHRL